MNGFFYSLQQELLARESSVSLTIGSLGLIWTKEMAQMFAKENRSPDWSTGSVEECSRGMMEAYITRPQTMTFPKLAGTIYRSLWYFKPNFHEGFINGIKPKGSEGTGYKETVEATGAKDDLREKIGYQQGYGRQ